MPETKAAGCLYLNPALPNIHQGPSGPNMVRRQLKFPAYQVPLYTEDEPIELPSLQSYLPTGTDPDSANALIALYRTHCISVIDCFRFCKEKMFWQHFTSFHGTLTVPVQKLLAHPDIAAWVTECDWLMYQKMIRFVSPLALQVMPPKVIDTFRNISIKLSNHISNTFQNHPQHVRDAKLGPATIFAGLIDRLLRVNATAHAAANMLTNDANRDQMWHDWICYVRPISVVESSLPGDGYTRTLQILTNEVRDLLGPLTAISYAGMQPVYTNAAHNNFSQHANAELDDSSTSGVLDRWTTFLHDLPSRFPGADARLLLHCVGEVGSAALRDITMAQALSFGSWWVTKVWVDEMLQWLAEKGGFLEQSPSSMEMRPQKRSAFEAGFSMDDRDETYGGSRPRTGVSDATEGPSRYGSVEFHREQSHVDPQVQNDRYRQPPTAQMDGPQNRNGPQTPQLNSEFPQRKNKQTELEQMQSHDDSGIGMDFELPQNTPTRLADYGGFVASGTNVGSDPADVVVC
ncbi:hypothetical protein OEA41_008786 [Lepraria neglecta]|uniref:RFX1-4/6/8-like BCD domain-containing protein n=1 Tax=Lepraria neglecta TaxID=209136 RepID=A0AAD9Z4N5_9LECA|nr:hypothetical protein OEA41_008786 [Lepraria neglecta]